MRHWRCLWTAAAVAALLLSACDGSPEPRPLPRPTSAPPDAVAACSRATATTRSDQLAAVGDSAAPQIGPFSFHIYDHQNGYPTKVLIGVTKDYSEAIRLTGSRCSDGRALRFWYEERREFPGPLPKTEEQMQAVGEETAQLSPAPVGDGHAGYIMFSSKGRWQVTVTQGGIEVGVLLVEIV